MSKSDLPQGTLDLLILQTLAAGPLHGYGISQRMTHRSRDLVRVQQGSLYPALHRLEEKGWLDAEWHESEQGRMAKFYSLTRSGRKRLASERDSWSRLLEGVGLILQSE
jgi:PadR family transcriptional regulator PadR